MDEKIFFFFLYIKQKKNSKLESNAYSGLYLKQFRHTWREQNLDKFM